MLSDHDALILMRKITVIIDQLDHCKTLILGNETACLRMSLILLDNTAEILMYRKVLDEFNYNEMYEKILDRAKKTLPPDVFDKFTTEVAIPEILEAKRKWRILKYFAEKVSFLCETCALIPKEVAAVLSSLHRYRNETYHRDIIRDEILRPVAILYFEIVCELMSELKHSTIEYIGSDDWTPFFQKYNLGKGRYGMLNGEDIEAILNGFRAALVIDVDELKSTFRAYLKNRLDETLNRLDFIGRTLGINSIDTTLKLVQFSQSVTAGRYGSLDILLRSQEFNSYQPPVIQVSFDRWRESVGLFGNIIKKMELFSAFKSVEEEFEPIEKRAHEVADELDAAIQFYVDLARGK